MTKVMDKVDWTLAADILSDHFDADDAYNDDSDDDDGDDDDTDDDDGDDGDDEGGLEQLTPWTRALPLSLHFLIYSGIINFACSIF